MDQKEKYKARGNVEAANIRLFWPLLTLLAFGVAIRAAVALHPYSGMLSSNKYAALKRNRVDNPLIRSQLD